MSSKKNTERLQVEVSFLRRYVERLGGTIPTFEEMEKQEAEYQQLLSELAPIRQQWKHFCETNSEVSDDIQKKLYPLLQHPEEAYAEQAFALLESLDSSCVLTVLDCSATPFDVRRNVRENQELIGRWILAQITDRASLWSPLLRKGLFDYIVLLGTTGSPWTALDPDVKTRLLCATTNMMVIPAGEFKMGALDGDGLAEGNERPQKMVHLTSAFMMGQYPVTNALWEDVWQIASDLGSSLPVNHVSWVEAIIFCNLLSEREGLQPVYSIPEELQEHCLQNRQQNPAAKSSGAQLLPLIAQISQDPSANGYRLPTEAEWEYAARGNNYSNVYSGSHLLEEVAWKNGERGVGQKRANEYGLYEMSGPIGEWCWDMNVGYISKSLYGWGGFGKKELLLLAQSLSVKGRGTKYQIRNAISKRLAEPFVNPTGPTLKKSTYRTYKCGRVSYRGCDSPESTRSQVGLRLCRTMSTVDQDEKGK